MLQLFERKVTESAQCSSLRFISWDLGLHAEQGVQINGKKISNPQMCNTIVAQDVLFWGPLMDEVVFAYFHLSSFAKNHHHTGFRVSVEVP